MEKPETIEIRDVTAAVEEEMLVVRLKLFNPAQRTLYSYGEPERIIYDGDTGRLTLQLHDQDAEEDSVFSEHLSEPLLTPLEGQAETEIKIVLPKVMGRLRSAAERGGDGPLVEQLRVSEAKEIDLEIAYNDTPFYENPNLDFAPQLKEWGRNIVKATFRNEPCG